MYNKSNRFYEPPMPEISSNKEKRYYSPQLSETASVSLRRFAWALGLHMTEAAALMVKLIPCYVNTQKICLSCTDKSKCHCCSFSQEKQNNIFLNLQFTQKEQDALMAVQ